MADEPGGGGSRGPNAGKELPQHPLVESLRPDPAQPARKTVVLIGLPGKSDRPGYQRLYLTTKLNYYAEFLVSGILNAQTIPADKSPFPGHEATQVTIGRDANIQYTQQQARSRLTSSTSTSGSGRKLPRPRLHSRRIPVSTGVTRLSTRARRNATSRPAIILARRDVIRTPASTRNAIRTLASTRNAISRPAVLAKRNATPVSPAPIWGAATVWGGA